MGPTGINMEMVKQKNRISIIYCITQQGPISRKDISNILQLTPAAVTQICNPFIEKGLLVETGVVEENNRAGRKKVLLDINYDYMYTLAVDMNAERTVVAITNLKGDLVSMDTLPSGKEYVPEDFLRKVASACKGLAEKQEITFEKIIGLGFSISGLVDTEHGISTKAFGIWDEEVPVVDIMKQHLGDIEVVLDNDVTALAIAEAWLGYGKGIENTMMVRWGPGVGAAIIANRRPYSGNNGKAAEIGHFIIQKNGKLCNCGRHGCLETLISYDALSEEFARVFSKEKTPRMYEILKGDFANFSRKTLSNILEDMDTAVEEFLDDALDVFARTIVNSMTIFAPERVFLTGNLFKSTFLYETLIAYCSFYDEKYGEDNIMQSSLGDSAEYIGAACLMIRHFILNLELK